MVPIPALLLAQPDEPFAGSGPSPADTESAVLDAEVRGLGVALEALQRSPTSRELRAMQKLAHEVMARAEQSGFAEVANAVLHIEDALTAIVDGELEVSEATRRQIDAAFRAARGACALRLAEASSSDAAGLRGSLLLVVKDQPLMQEITRAASRRKFLASSATGPEEARDIASAATFSGVIMDFDGDSVEQSQALALLIRELPGTRHCPLVVVAENPSFALRLAAARSRAALLIPKPISG